jgi:predicted small lipoprotein YifL
MKMRHTALSCILVLSLAGCGYQGGYRYPCQDPANWEAKECNPPICEPSGTCSRDLVGKTVWEEYQNGKNNG